MTVRGHLMYLFHVQYVAFRTRSIFTCFLHLSGLEFGLFTVLFGERTEDFESDVYNIYHKLSQTSKNIICARQSIWILPKSKSVCSVAVKSDEDFWYFLQSKEKSSQQCWNFMASCRVSVYMEHSIWCHSFTLTTGWCLSETPYLMDTKMSIGVKVVVSRCHFLRADELGNLASTGTGS